jgi:hypothetical protein
MTPVRKQNRQRFLEAILRHRDLLILGYSGGDDLDIVPILADAEPEHALWWVNHCSTMPNIESAVSLVKRLKVPTPLETIGRDRALLERGPGDLVRTTGLEPVLSQRSRFSYHLDFRRRLSAFVVWTVPSPWPEGFRRRPSSLYTFP